MTSGTWNLSPLDNECNGSAPQICAIKSLSGTAKVVVGGRVAYDQAHDLFVLSLDI